LHLVADRRQTTFSNFSLALARILYYYTPGPAVVICIDPYLYLRVVFIRSSFRQYKATVESRFRFTHQLTLLPFYTFMKQMMQHDLTACVVNIIANQANNRRIAFNRVGIQVLARKITENGNILQIKIPIHFFIKDIIIKCYSNFNFRLVGSKCILVYTCYYSLAYFQVFFLFIGRQVLIVKVIYDGVT
jgi:hypothetical protein